MKPAARSVQPGACTSKRQPVACTCSLQRCRWGPPAAPLTHPLPPSSRPTGRGHYRLVQMILEAAVVREGPDRAKQRCINHANKRGQSALILACVNGWVPGVTCARRGGGLAGTHPTHAF